MQKIKHVTKKHINELFDKSFKNWHEVFDKCLILSIQLPNGYVFLVESACVDTADYNFKIAKDICIRKAKEKIGQLEAYLLQDRISQEEKENERVKVVINDIQTKLNDISLDMAKLIGERNIYLKEK